MRVLVTGATGFVGMAVTQRLVAAGWQVTALVRPISRPERRERLRALGAAVANGDVTDPGSLGPALAGVEALVHCAGHVQDWGPREPFSRANVLGTGNVVRAAVDAGVRRLVHISTTDVYGYPHRRQVTEEHPQRVRNFYNETKILGERVVRAHAGGRAVILRPASIYGPGSYSIVVEFLRQLKEGYFPFFRSRQVIAGLTHIENLVDAVELALMRPAAGGEAFNLTDGSDVTWEQFVDALAGLLGRKVFKPVLPYALGWAAGSAMEYANILLGGRRRPLLTRMAIQLLGNHQDFSIARVRAGLGYEPRVGFAEGMELTAAWLRREGLLAAGEDKAAGE